MTKIRTVSFLEKTAQAMPDRDIRHSGVMVCFGSYSQQFMYCQTHTGGSMTRIDRDTAEQIMARTQAN
jgi:hypothetical protein